MSEALIIAPHWRSNFAGVHFGIEVDLTAGTFPEWTVPEPRWGVLELMGGGIVRQYLGAGPTIVTYGIELESDADARALMATMGTGETNDLVVYDGSSWQEGETEVAFDDILTRYDGVYLIDLVSVERDVEGNTRWLATFERAVAP